MTPDTCVYSAYTEGMRVQHLFHSADPEKQTLHRRITPTAEQRTQQQERWNDVRDYLIGDLSQRTGLGMASWLQGSYKFGTQVRPVKGGEFDIDLGIYFVWPGAAKQGPYDPEQVKALVQESLKAYSVEAEEDVREVIEPPKERCSRIRFSGDFHIDVPSYHLDVDADERSLATLTLGWEYSDPKALYAWFRGLFDEDDDAQVRRLIRYLKIWSALNLDCPPASILLTILTAEAYQTLSPSQAESDDVALGHLAGVIANRLTSDGSVPNPAQPEEDLNRLSPDDLQAFIQSLRNFEALARSALAAATEADSAHHWTIAFHHFFPAPREARDGSGNYALVPVAFDPQVAVKAMPKAGTHTFQGVNRIGPIPKDCSITFALQNAHQLPAGARVRWIVRNEGSEAEQINDLGHLAGEGNVATENSAYRGTHYMDVVVVSALGGILGYRRIPVQIQALPMPPRNPRRPGWTRFRRR